MIPQLIFAIKYNRIYLQRLLERGFKVKSTGGVSIDVLNEKLQMELPVLTST